MVRKNLVTAFSVLTVSVTPAIVMLGLVMITSCTGLSSKPTTVVDAVKPDSLPRILSAQDPDNPPAAPREFRAAWVATVANIDWPSKPGLPSAEQQAEIKRILDQSVELKLNAIVLQVRPSADAIYPSSLEPWAEYLTGEQGKPPEPFYDPLKMWIDEAHQRGIEIHAWLNPYRAKGIAAKGPLAATHIANTHPSAVKAYGNQLWMDPAEPIAAQRTMDVVLDVLRRYDVDGIHIDDYFYPYPITEGTPAVDVDFPDEPAWKRYQSSGGTLARADWRREQVNQLIERMYTSIHVEKPWVRFGVSPFGIGRPDRRPEGIKGFSQYDKLYADVKLWMSKGWLDYLVPQLYWKIDSKEQPFAPLLDYWAGQNTQKRHVWSGLYTSRINDTPQSWTPDEITNQIGITRERTKNNLLLNGHVHFSMKALSQNRQGIADQLKQISTTTALVPAAPWLSSVAPSSPKVSVQQTSDQSKVNINVQFAQLTLENAQNQNVAHVAVWLRYGEQWQFQTVPVTASAVDARLTVDMQSNGNALKAIVVSNVNRFGNESARVILKLS